MEAEAEDLWEDRNSRGVVGGVPRQNDLDCNGLG